jgi:hypothetical protein
MVIRYWIIKSTDTNSENVLFNSLFRMNNYSKVPQCYVISILLVFFWHLTLFVCGGAVCVLLRHFNRCLNFVNYVTCWILWLTSIKLFSCMTYCVHYSNFLFFHLIISLKRCIIVLIWNQVNLRCRMQTIRSILSRINKSIYNFLWKISLEYIIARNF